MTEVETAQKLLAAVLKRWQEDGGDLNVLAQSMAVLGIRTMGGIVGSDRAAEIGRNIADAEQLRDAEALAGINVTEPSEEDHRLFVADVLDQAPAAFNREALSIAAVLHGGQSLAARAGAEQAKSTLHGVIDVIDRLAADRQFRTGGRRRDAN